MIYLKMNSIKRVLDFQGQLKLISVLQKLNWKNVGWGNDRFKTLHNTLLEKRFVFSARREQNVLFNAYAV